MRNVFLTLILLSLCTLGMGQINLREGIVITLQGDTLHGDIDYRTDEMNAKNGLFRQDGTSDLTNFQPGEIKAYRFLENGRYYVSKHTPDGKLLFLEYVVRGQLNLYYVGSTIHNNIYYLENEKGELIQFEEQNYTASKVARRKNLYQAFAMTRESESTQKMLWRNDLTRDVATKAVVNYNHEVCPDGECEILEYRSKILPQNDRTVHITMLAGYLHYGAGAGYYNFNGFKDLTYKNGWTTSVGIEAYMPKVYPGLYGEAYLSLYHIEDSGTEEFYFYDPETFQYVPYPIDNKAVMNYLSLKAGFGYQFEKLRVQPRVHIGYAMNLDWESGEYNSEKMDVGASRLYHGYYAGAGVAYPLKKGAIVLDFTFHRSSHSDHVTSTRFRTVMQRFSYTLGYQF